MDLSMDYKGGIWIYIFAVLVVYLVYCMDYSLVNCEWIRVVVYGCIWIYMDHSIWITTYTHDY